MVGDRSRGLQDITEADALAEGVTIDPNLPEQTARAAFEALWCRINGKESWADNPWVWVVEFERIKP